MKSNPSPRKLPPLPGLPVGLSEIVFAVNARGEHVPAGIRAVPGCEPGHVAVAIDQLAAFKAAYGLRTVEVLQAADAETIVVVERVEP